MVAANHVVWRTALGAWLALALGVACDGGAGDTGEVEPVEVAEGALGAMGDPVGWATAEQLEAFDRGREVALRRFDLGDGLGPAFNVTFCASCHEKPVTGGSAGLYRNFFLSGVLTDDGAFFPGHSAGMAGGVIRLYYYGDEETARPEVPEATNVIAQRNPIPFFGTGLLAEISDEEILSRADPDDADGDGISGRPNYDQGFVGRFGRKAQTVSIEGFIRGPLFNHLGITTDPLDEAQKAALPVDSSGGEATIEGAMRWLGVRLARLAQAAAPAGPLTDDDGVADPEMSTADLFDLVTFAMLLAGPEPEPLSALAESGRAAFAAAGCEGCHTPLLVGPRGGLPIYSDLLLHDMGEALADGLFQGEATGSEFRTQPLWGLSATGPYLHDGRGTTLDDAIRAHDGEARASRLAYEALSADEQAALQEFLMSLGGRDQASAGLIPPGTPVDEVGAYGGPRRALTASEEETFLAGRTLFDREFGFAEGLGGPRLNGDSCRACHTDPVVGGAGPRGVNVIRHGILNSNAEFTPPAVGTILHRTTALTENANLPQPEANTFELRQTPHLFGLGLIESIPDETILAGADPTDADGDGITGRASFTDGGQLGRFGWKAQVPSVAEFVRDAVTAELGMTLEYVPGLTFGGIYDNDAVADPEFSAADAELLTTYLQLLAPPPRQAEAASEEALAGEGVFDTVGCAGCHVPSLEGSEGPVPLYSDLLLHEILPEGAMGIEDASANVREFRTSPLWGLAKTAPYLHSGAADTLDEAIRAHDGEATAVRESYEALSADDRAALLTFLGTL